MLQIKKTILTLVALLAVTTGAWAQTGENIFQYCYDCQRNPDYPKTTASAKLDGFENPLVGYKGSGFGMDNTPAGPWKLEYVGLWSTTNQYGIDDIWNYQSIYNCTDVPVFRLYQWNATANEYQHAAYGVVCAYAKVSNAVEHTAFFEAEGGWGCVLTNSSHSSSMNITFDEDLTTGLTALIAAATPDASGPEVAWTAASKTGTFTMPGGNVELEPEYYPQATMVAGAVTAVAGVKATTDDPLVTLDKTKLIGASGMMYYVGTTDTKPAYNAEGWTSEVPTAADITMAKTVYVWYYPVGADSDNPAKTYSDGEMNINALQVAVADPPTYAVTFAEGTPEADKWATNIPDGGVVKGETVTVTYTGTKKVLGVKAEKKAAAVSLIVNPEVGQVIGSDGKNYDADALLPTGVAAVAMIAYVGSETGDDTYKNGLAIALADESGTMNWSTAVSICGAKTAITGAKWCLPSQDQWKQMFKANGGKVGSYNGLNTTITTAGGTTLQEFANYWSSSEGSPGVSAYSVDLRYGSANWYDDSEDHNDYLVRACLAF